MKSPSKFTIRRATQADVQTLVSLMREFHAESSYTLDQARAERAFTELLAHPEIGAVWVADQDETRAGYVVLTRRYSMDRGALDGHIEDLFVRPRFRRRGIGSALLAAIIDEAGSSRELHVEVAGGDAPANALYKHCGFEAPSDGRVFLRRRIDE